jgi:hypothetical protein
MFGTGHKKILQERSSFFEKKEPKKLFCESSAGGRVNIPCKGYKKSFAELFFRKATAYFLK